MCARASPGTGCPCARRGPNAQATQEAYASSSRVQKEGGQCTVSLMEWVTLTLPKQEKDMKHGRCQETYIGCHCDVAQGG